MASLSRSQNSLGNVSELNKRQRYVDQLWHRLVCRCWESPNFEEQLLSGGLPNILRNHIAKPSIDEFSPKEFEAICLELSARLSTGIPSNPNQFAQSPNDFVAMWDQEFEPDRSGDDTIPFADVFLTLAESALKQIPVVQSKLRKEVIDELRRDLTRLLSGIGGQPLQMMFSVSCLSDTSYDDFVEYTIQTGMAKVFDEYPELETVLRMACTTWSSAVAEFLTRLRFDTQLLETTFNVAVSAKRITSLQIGLSDRHSDGRTVVGVTFECGRKLIYKPRCLGLEREYNNLLDWIGKAGFEPTFQRLQVAEGNGYGWIECASPAACKDDESTRSYYQRAGALAALWWALDATDIHMANIFACGPHPVLIDVETFFQSADRSANRGDRGIGQLAFFPRSENGVNCRFDVSGLGGTGGQRTDRKVPVWENVGKNSMLIRYEIAILKGCSNNVKTGERMIGPMSHAVALNQGYSSMMLFLKSQSAALLSTDGPLEKLFGQARRKVNRGTRVYFAAISASLQLSNLRCSTKRRASIENTLGPDATDEEISAIMRLDIPRFAVADCEAPRQEVRRRFALINEELIASHCKDIRSALLNVLFKAGGS